MTPASTLVVMPAFREEAAIGSTLDALLAVRDRLGLDIVVIDDGSDDATGRVARERGVPVVRLPVNLGIGAALRAGFRYAVEHGYRRVVQFDADGQHRPDEIAALLAVLDEGAHLVVGDRFAAGDYRVGYARRVAMAGLRLGVGLLTRRRFRDTSSGFRGIAEPLLSAFAAHYPTEYMDSVEALVAACRAGYDVREVPVHMDERAAGAASTQRMRLAYHYLRVLVALVGSSRRSLPPAPTT